MSRLRSELKQIIDQFVVSSIAAIRAASPSALNDFADKKGRRKASSPPAERRAAFAVAAPIRKTPARLLERVSHRANRVALIKNAIVNGLGGGIEGVERIPNKRLVANIGKES